MFSLGAVLAFAATGRRPFGRGQATSVLQPVVRGAPDLQGAPTEVLPLIERCLVKDPAGRPECDGLLAEVTAVAAALEPGLGPSRPLPRRWWRPLVTASAVTGILAAGSVAGPSNAVTGHQPGPKLGRDRRHAPDG